MDAQLKLGFAPGTGGTINGTLSATSGAKENALSFSVNTTKKRLVSWLNFNLKSSDVTGEVFVRRTNPNGSTTDSAKIPLEKYQTSDDFQANKATIPCEIFLDDGDELILATTNGSGSTVSVGYAAEYRLL